MDLHLDLITPVKIALIIAIPTVVVIRLVVKLVKDMLSEIETPFWAIGQILDGLRDLLKK